MLIHLVDATAEDPARRLAHRARRSLPPTAQGLAEKPELVALNKVDALDAETRAAKARGAAGRLRRARRSWSPASPARA